MARQWWKPRTGASTPSGRPTVVMLAAVFAAISSLPIVLPTPSVSGVVWYDQDHDGARGADEAGLTGVRVELRTCRGRVVRATRTGRDGSYSFRNVARSCYVVRIAAPAAPLAWWPTTLDNGLDVPSDVDSLTGLSEQFYVLRGSAPVIVDGVVVDAVAPGDGVIGAGEACDDANPLAGDGCAPDGEIESGFECEGEPSTCAAIPGDGLVRGTEQCDDANPYPWDGCDAETGLVGDRFTCEGEPSVCVLDEEEDEDGDGGVETTVTLPEGDDGSTDTTIGTDDESTTTTESSDTTDPTGSTGTTQTTDPSDSTTGSTTGSDDEASDTSTSTTEGEDTSTTAPPGSDDAGDDGDEVEPPRTTVSEPATFTTVPADEPERTDTP